MTHLPKHALIRGTILCLSVAILITLLLLTLPTQATAQGRGTIIWKQTGGPSGGGVGVITVDPVNPAVVYACTEASLFKSTDAGASWQPVGQGLPPGTHIQDLLIDSRVTTALYIGSYSGIYRSTDGGVTWAASNKGLLNLTILALVGEPSSTITHSILYAGTSGGLFKSTDGGLSWGSASLGLAESEIYALALDPLSSPGEEVRLYAGTRGKVYRSNDGGAHWQNVSKDLPEVTIQTILVHPGLPSLLYAATDEGIYRSLDQGITWAAILPGNSIVSLAIEPQPPYTLYAGTSDRGVFKSLDNGQSWQAAGDLGGAIVLSLTPDTKTPGTLYVGTSERGVFKSTNSGAAWTATNRGLIGTNIRTLLVDSQSPYGLYAGATSGFYHSQDEGATWTLSNQGLGTNTYVLSLVADPRCPGGDKACLFAGTWGGGVYRSEDGGRTWKPAGKDLVEAGQVSALAISAVQGNDAPILYAGTESSGVYRSADSGASWVAMNKGLTNQQIQGLVVEPVSTGRWMVYVATSGGLFRRQDGPGPVPAEQGNETWTAMYDGLAATEIRALAVDLRTPPILYVGTATGLYKSADGGETWSALSSGSLPTNFQVRTLILDPRPPKGANRTLYAGTDSGVFRSSDGGVSWQAANDGLPNRADIQALAVSPRSPTMLYAGTQGSGIYRGMEQETPLVAPPVIYAIIILIFALGLLAIFFATRLARLPQEAQDSQAIERRWPSWRRQIADALSHNESVNPSMLTQVPREWRQVALQRYVEDHPDDDLTLRESPLRLELADPQRLRAFSKDWGLARERLDSPVREGYDSFERQASRLTDQICHVLGFARLTDRSYKDFCGYLLKAPTLRLRIPSQFPIIFLQKKTFTNQDIEDLIALMSLLEATNYFALLVPFAQQRELKRLVGESACDFIVLGLTELRQILMARDPERRLVEIILDQVDITVISPYVTNGPVPDNMFFGREFEIKTITRMIKERNFALVGGRKIGKTSLLHKAHRILSTTGGYYVLYLDCQAVRDYESLSSAMETMWRAKAPESTPSGIQALFAAIRKNRPSETIVVLLDEVDALFQYDIGHNWELSQVFRALAQEGYVRFVFCGERVLDHALHDPTSPFFNFCDILRLGYMDTHDVQRIVMEPMSAMGLEVVEGESLVQQVMEVSSGHPNLVQYLCHNLIVLTNKRRSRSVSPADMEKVGLATSFQDYFLETVWGNTNPLERLITLLIPPEGLVTVAQVQEMLENRLGFAQVEQALDFLVLISILEKRGKSYTFLNRSFPRIVHESQDVNGLTEQLKEELV